MNHMHRVKGWPVEVGGGGVGVGVGGGGGGLRKRHLLQIHGEY